MSNMCFTGQKFSGTFCSAWRYDTACAQSTLQKHNPTGIYLFKVNNGNTKANC